MPANKVNKKIDAQIHLINQQRKSVDRLCILCIKLCEEHVITANKQGKKPPSKGELKRTVQRPFETGR